MRRQEVNYFVWNTEARAFVLCVFVWLLLVPTILGLEGFSHLCAAVFSISALLLMIWDFTYLYRAGEQQRRRLEFTRIWGRQDGPDRNK